MNIQWLITSTELVGTVAFAISGVMVAREHQMDILGALVLGCVTAVGGGVIRDILVGNIPPLMFRTPIYVNLAIVVSLLTFAFLKWEEKYLRQHSEEIINRVYDWVMNIADSIGLAVFAVSGTQVVLDGPYAEYMGMAVFVGTLSAVGGGVLRDIMANKIPSVLRKKVYALAAFLGAQLYYSLSMDLGMDRTMAELISIAAMLLLRYLAIHYKWNLPSFRPKD